MLEHRLLGFSRVFFSIPMELYIIRSSMLLQALFMNIIFMLFPTEVPWFAIEFCLAIRPYIRHWVALRLKWPNDIGSAS
jgi:hypothetical protein